MDQLKKVTTSIEEDCAELAGISDAALARMAGLTEAVGIPTVGTVSANQLTEGEVPPQFQKGGDAKKDDAKKDDDEDDGEDDEVKESDDEDYEDDEDDEDDEDEGDEESEGCDTPGEKKKSNGKGRGLAKGNGKGPIGVPVDEDEETLEIREMLGDDFDSLVTEAKKKKKKKKMDAFVKELSKRKDVRDPEALAGWLANYNPPNWEDVNHPIDGPFVTEEMLNRFGALPFDVMEEEDFERVIAELQTKELPEDAPDDLRSLAEEVAHTLLEARRRAKKRKAMKRAGKQKFMKCTREGTHWDPAKKACVPAAGAYIPARREKTRKAGRGIQATHTSQRERKKEAMGIKSDTFAGRLADLVTEDKTAPQAEYTIREEVLDRLDRIFGLIDEEFFDSDVSKVLLGVMEDLDEKAEAGLMAEDAMSEDEFIASLAPAIKLIRECFDKINEMDSADDEEDDSEEDDSEDKSKDEDLLGNLKAL